jgi:nucleoside-diphosphate-sugar epimerase
LAFADMAEGKSTLLNTSMMQTILGGGGAIGVELAKALPGYTTENVRIVSRNPVKVNKEDELMVADLTDAQQVMKAVEGSSVVYLTAGLPYKLAVWQSQWPLVMKNVLEACKAHKSKLVFFDNIYMYDGSNLNPITEDLPINPPSKKGAVRAAIFRMLMDAVEKGEVEALIARSADFYGPSIKNTSVLTETVINPLSKGQTANWLGDVNKLHSFTYTPDAGKATALLGNSPDAYGQVWHVPTAANPLTGKEWIEAFAAAFGVKPKYRVAGKTMVKIMGLFIPVMREMPEMMYQNDRDYVFSSAKFEARFGMHPTPYSDGIKAIMKIDYGK